jgi:hypothetical protein
MRRKKIGTKHFEGIVDITDPCYDRDVWCRMTAEVKAGEYECHIWRQTKKCNYDGREYKDVRVGVIGIYLDGIIPAARVMEEIGEIGVDAGLAGFFMNKPDYNDEEWDDLCNSIHDGDAWIRDDGFFSSSGYGDGCYGVYAYKIDNEIVALEIRFL